MSYYEFDLCRINYDFVHFYLVNIKREILTVVVRKFNSRLLHLQLFLNGIKKYAQNIDYDYADSCYSLAFLILKATLLKFWRFLDVRNASGGI